MEPHIENKLELAIMLWVENLDHNSLVEMVTDQMWTYYRKNADLDEVLEFIEDMGVTDEDVSNA